MERWSNQAIDTGVRRRSYARGFVGFRASRRTHCNVRQRRHLVVEQPRYTQLTFALDRVKAEAPLHPEWKDTQPFKAVLENDMGTLAKIGDQGLAELVLASHAGMTTDEFQKIV